MEHLIYIVNYVKKGHICNQKTSKNISYLIGVHFCINCMEKLLQLALLITYRLKERLFSSDNNSDKVIKIHKEES